MRSKGEALAAALVVLSLAACGTDSQTSQTDTSTAEGTLVQDPPPRLASLTADALASNLQATPQGQQLLQLAGAPLCGVDFYYFTYWTVDGSGKPASATGSLMVPNGTPVPPGAGTLAKGAGCTGPRPVVLYAHGTTADQTYNIADISNTSNSANGESALIAAEFAAQGYIVVAPNFVGYDASSSAYHPYLNAKQNAQDMIDALTAARKALPNTFASTTTDSGALVITGYSGGGYVAMATHQALQAAGKPVVASAPMSGPYALAAFADYVFLGHVNIGSTVFAPLITRSYQAAYGNVYAQPSDFYNPPYHTSAPNLLPSTKPLSEIFTNNLLPETALFNSTPASTGNATLDAALKPPSNPADPATPIYDLGFGSAFLVTDNYRISYVLDAAPLPGGNPDEVIAQTGLLPAASPQFPLRQDFKLNDLRGFVPHAPVLLCGGDADPTVFYAINTGVVVKYWTALVQQNLLPAQVVNYLDVNAPPGTGTTDAAFAPLQAAFQSTYGGLVTAQGQATAVASYHATVAPFCTTAARDFFSTVLSQL
jgi:hypothetical protein